jgi:hypothetical protein
MWKRMLDGVQGRVTRFRAPGGAPNPEGAGEPDAPGEPGYHDRAMPEGAILWTPLDRAGQGAPPPTVPIFISQRALLALHDHCTATRGRCFGLLGGDLYRSPDSGTPYVMVESTIRLPGEAGEDAQAALSRGWPTAQDVLRRTGVQLVGWYRAGESIAPEPSPAELEAHTALFFQPWQIVVTAAPGAVSVGGVYRPSVGNASTLQPLPFHEVLDPSSKHGDSGAHPQLSWTNYRSDTPTFVPATAPLPPAGAAPTPAAASVVAPPAPPAPLALVAPVAPRAPADPALPAHAREARRSAPVRFLSDPVEARRVARPLRGGTLSLLTQRRAVRVATYTTGGLVAAFGVLRVFFAAPAALRPPREPLPAAATVLAQMDRAADTLALAISAFDLRARLFSNHQMQCPELARGLVLVEERWAAYNAVRKDGGLALDSARTARDRGLYADADAVERRFEASACPRP